jgi:hypothetical protein
MFTTRKTCLVFAVTLLMGSHLLAQSRAIGLNQDAVFGDVLLEVMDNKVVIGFDAFDDLIAGDGYMDLIVTFEATEAIDYLEPLRAPGFLQLRDGSVELRLPTTRELLRFAANVDNADQEDGALVGLALGWQAPPEGLLVSLDAAVANAWDRLAAQERELRYRLDLAFDDSPENPGSGSCASSCSKNCNGDGGSCSVTCTGGKCAQCSCPANCYCSNF